MVPVMNSPVSLRYAVLGMLSGRPRCADDAYGDVVDMLWPTEMTRMGTVFVQALTALHQQVGCQMPLVQRKWAWCSGDLAAHIAAWYGDAADLTYTMFPDGGRGDPVAIGARGSFVKGVLVRKGFWDAQQQAWVIPVTDLAWGFVLYQVVLDLRWYGATMVYEAFEGVLVIIRLPLTPFAEQLVALPWPWDDPANGALDTRGDSHAMG